MTNITKIVESYFESLKGKKIEIENNDTLISGIFLSFKSREYFYELLMKIGRCKKRIYLFLPFSVLIDDKSLTLEYGVKFIPFRIKKELMYNSCVENNSFNKTIKIHEVRPNTELS